MMSSNLFCNKSSSYPRYNKAALQKEEPQYRKWISVNGLVFCYHPETTALNSSHKTTQEKHVLQTRYAVASALALNHHLRKIIPYYQTTFQAIVTCHTISVSVLPSQQCLKGGKTQLFLRHQLYSAFLFPINHHNDIRKYQ